MNRRIALGVIAIAALVASPAGAQSMSVQAPPGGLDVNVVNPPDNPVPVEVQGVPAVDVSNTPETPLHVRDVDRQARIPVLDGCDLFIEDGETSDACSFDEVEVGKRLVVEFISGWIGYPVGQTGEAHTLLSRPSGFFTNHYLLQTLQRTNVVGDDKYVISQPFRIDVPEEGRLSVRVIRSPDDTGEVSGSFWITGYLVDVDEE
ncbi:MAG: hypothetical protein PVF51_09485 [Nitrospirota bacterium]|jgi:hypothetical protein